MDRRRKTELLGRAGPARGLCLFGLLIAAFATAQDVPMPPEFAPVRESIEKSLERGRVPSISLAAVKDDRVVWAEGFGFADLERRSRASADSIYILASVSKPITATGLMVLVDRGRIDLDRPANDYLPGFRLKAHRGGDEAMTVRRLANHTAGLPLHYNFFFGDDRPPPWAETIRRYGFAAWAPGTHWEYSNLGFGILGFMTEAVSGTPWGRFLEKEVFDPLGMDRTSDRVRPGREGDRTLQYRFEGGSLRRVEPYLFDHPGASTIWSSAADLARFMRMHLNDGALAGARILREESARAMRRPASGSEPDSRTGIGWALGTHQGRTVFWHSGGMPGVSTLVRGYPEERAATIVLTNGEAGAVTGEVSDALARILLGEPRSPQAPLPPAKPPPASPAAPETPEPPLGVWEGKIERFEGSIPLRLEVRKGISVLARSGSADLGSFTRVSCRDGGLTGRLPSPFPMREGYSGRVQLEFQLLREGGRLRGLCIAMAPEAFALSHWVELSRREERSY